MSSNLLSLYQIQLPISEEYEEVIEDVLRLFVIQFTMFVMYYISSSQPISVINYVVMQTFMLIGVAMYWLVFRKLVRIKTIRKL